MSVLKRKENYSKNGPYDELYTPSEAVEMIIPYIPNHFKTAWECTAIKECRIVEVLRSHDYEVITSHLADGFDFFQFEPDKYDIIITNPPYSIKDRFLKRAFELGKPFMFLLPLTSLEGLKRGRMFRENGIQLLIPDKRFNFMAEKKSGAWFQTSWFTWGLDLEKDLNFIPVKCPVGPNIMGMDNSNSIDDLKIGFRQAA